MVGTPSLELRISQMLRRGAVLSGGLLLVGWISLLWQQKSSPWDSFSSYHTQSLIESLKWALFLKDYPTLLIFSGLIILVLLPLIRVGMTGILFFRQKEITLAFMAFFVFAIIVVSFILGVDL